MRIDEYVSFAIDENPALERLYMCYLLAGYEGKQSTGLPYARLTDILLRHDL
jgi:hypothetical protein